MKDTELGSRIASIHNGSALFTGDAGSGESDIRTFIIESDFIECIISLPEDMFYNTSQPTYVLILTNRKESKRKGKIQLIDASSFYTKLVKPLGKKRYEIPQDKIDEILQLHTDFKINNLSRIIDNKDFGFLRFSVKHPMQNEKGEIVKDIKGKEIIDASIKDIEFTSWM